MREATAVSAETHIMDNIGIKAAGFVSGMVSNAYTTTAPDMGTTIGLQWTHTTLRSATSLALCTGFGVLRFGGESD